MIAVTPKQRNPAEVKLEQLRDQLFPGSANEIYDRNVHKRLQHHSTDDWPDVDALGAARREGQKRFSRLL